MICMMVGAVEDQRLELILVSDSAGCCRHQVVDLLRDDSRIKKERGEGVTKAVAVSICLRFYCRKSKTP